MFAGLLPYSQTLDQARQACQEQTVIITSIHDLRTYGLSYKIKKLLKIGPSFSMLAGLLPYSQTLDQACQEQTLWLITNIDKLRTYA